MNKCKEVVAISDDGHFRALYDHDNLGAKGKLQELRPDGYWLTVLYCDDYAELLLKFHEINGK